MKGYAEAEGEGFLEAQTRWAHTAKASGRMGPIILVLERFLVSIFCPMSSFSIKTDVVFCPDLISCKNQSEKRLC